MSFYFREKRKLTDVTLPVNCEKCREPLGYATISKRLVFFKQHTPIKIFKPRLVRTLYHKNVNSSRCRIRFAINKEKAFLK